MNKKEKLNDIYLELLSWLEYEGKPSKSIWHPLFYRYPWGLRFELGEYALDDEDEYICSAYERGQRIWDTVFASDDEVLLIFDGTPDRELKEALGGCRMQRVRTPLISPLPEEDEEEDEVFFYRYFYQASAGRFPFPAVLKRAFCWKYGVYLYNRTKKLLFHPYDDRGADLIGPDRETVEPFYRSLNDLLLDWDREEMARKFCAVRKVFLRVLTTTTDPKTAAQIRAELEKRFRGAALKFSDCEPYWKCDGWGELSVTMDTAQPLESIQNRLARKWGSDTASADIRLPGVGFLWIGE